MKSIFLAFLGIVSVSMTAHADSNAWNNNKSGDIVTIMRIQPSQNFMLNQTTPVQF